MKKLLILLVLMLSCINVYSYDEFVDPNPTIGNGFGTQVIPLKTGNVVITSPKATVNGVDSCGAVYLFNGKTRQLISTLYGTTTLDMRSDTVIVLDSGNSYLVKNPYWDNKLEYEAGAVTICNGTTGVDGPISAANSLIGTHQDDNVGNGSVFELSNGVILVGSQNYKSKEGINLGAITWLNSKTPTTGTIDNTNSLIGRVSNELWWNLKYLSNGDCLLFLSSYTINNKTGAGALHKLKYPFNKPDFIDSTNSFVYNQMEEYGLSVVMHDLNNGYILILNPNWDLDEQNTDVGILSMLNINSDFRGTLDITNSLVGRDNHNLGFQSLEVLSNGNFLVNAYSESKHKNYFWADGTKPLSGFYDTCKSLVFFNAFRVTTLKNGNFISYDYSWTNSDSYGVGALTWYDGKNPKEIEIDSTNSLIGTPENVWMSSGEVGIFELVNGNYLIISSGYFFGSNYPIESLTFARGDKPISGVINQSNSLFGKIARISQDSIGNYFVYTQTVINYRQNKAILSMTMGDSEYGISGIIDTTNSIFCNIEYQIDDNFHPTESQLPNGTFLINIPYLNYDTLTACGGIFGFKHRNELHGYLDTSNTIIGRRSYDLIGDKPNIILNNGNFLINSTYWNVKYSNDSIGAVTWVDGTKKISGYLDIDNSFFNVSSNLINSIPPKGFRSLDYKLLRNGKYIVYNPDWSTDSLNRIGFISVLASDKPTKGVVNFSNSLIGSYDWDNVCRDFIELENGDVLLWSPYWGFINTGAVTYYNINNPLTGEITAENSIIGHNCFNDMARPIIDTYNKQYYSIFMPYKPEYSRVFVGKYKVDINIDTNSTSVINDFKLFPNPASNDISIHFELKNQSTIDISIVDVLGRKKENIINAQLEQGVYDLPFNLSKFSIGTYLIIINSNNITQSYPLNILR